MLVEGMLVLLPSLTTSGHEQVADPLTILTAASMTLYPAVSESGRGDVVGTGGGLAQSTQMTLGTNKSGWTSSAGQYTVMTGRPLACYKKTYMLFPSWEIRIVANCVLIMKNS